MVAQFFRKETIADWGASVAAHFIVLVVLLMFRFDTKPTTTVVSVISDLTELTQEDFQERLVPDDELRLDAPVSLAMSTGTGGGGGGTGAGAGAGPGGLNNPLATMQQSAAVMQTVSNKSLNRPLASVSVGKLSLGSNISGLKGTSEMIGGGGQGGSGGDAGFVDRVSQEVLRQIEKNKVIVAWIFDASLSLKERREAIANRFDRIYTELDALGVNENNALLTTVISVGAETRFLLDKPTNDVSAIRKAIRSIKEDESGKENLFTAIRETATRYRKLQTASRRTLLIVLMTDEIGDDLDMADTTVGLLQQFGVPLYVMGPIASFSRSIIHDHWVDKETGFHFWPEIKRGPYTRRDEFLRLVYDGAAYKSGFGTFALMQMARETGGIYFIYDDERVPGPKDYDMNILNRYKANYGPESAYTSEIGQSPMRRTLVDIASEGNGIWTDWPGWIHSQSWRTELQDRQNWIARYVAFCDKAIPRLLALDNEFNQETDQKWRANYLLTMARILLGKVRSDEYAWACADFKLNPRTLREPKKNNGWHFSFDRKELKVDQKPGHEPSADAAAKKAAASKFNAADPKKKEAALRMLEQSRKHFQTLLDEHSGTPWHEAARRELTLLPGGTWIEGHDPNDLNDPERAKLYKEAERRVPKK